MDEYFENELINVGINDQYGTNCDQRRVKKRKIKTTPIVSFEEVKEQLKSKNCNLRSKEDYENFYATFMEKHFYIKLFKFIQTRIECVDNQTPIATLRLEDYLNFF